ncbi:MAG: hypothetical protein ETSY1_27375 [Candidatus Entotheonella factor]|uniref:ABC transmembrane type-1 domain-containing protein n=1 Tax=Entotheonella factor TaxID=1429438 RepID=W4LFX4_ENTF1|nr:MAG: hypothetical protein ETSY1_27375 [Candidatus Entotheonella factor]
MQGLQVKPKPKEAAAAEPRPLTRTPFQRAMMRLRQNPLAMLGFWILVILYGSALFADFLAPYHYATGARKKSYNPPMISDIRFTDENGLRWPYVYNTYYEFDAYQRKVWHEDTSVKYPIRFFATGDEHKVLWLFSTRRHLIGLGNLDQYTGDPRNQPMLFLLGADGFGRDLFSRLLYGGRISLSIGLFGVAITFCLGMIIGGASGYFGGRTDFVIQRICEMLMLVPGFYLLLSLRAAIPTDWSSVQTYIAIIVILSFIGWAGLARTIRGLVFSIAQMEYVVAARAMGVKNGTIIVRHVLPNTFSYAIVAATMSIPGYVLGESGLSLIGLGISDPEASWGNLLAAAMDIAQIKFHPWILTPGFLIFLCVMSFNYLGDGLRDAFDPHGVQKTR